MRWIFPSFVAVLYLAVAVIWNFMTGRWTSHDWKELGARFLIMLLLVHVVFWGVLALNSVGVSLPPSAGPIVGIVVATLSVILTNRIRDRRRSSQLPVSSTSTKSIR
jgi:uncharacterized membrane-anchored protein